MTYRDAEAKTHLATDYSGSKLLQSLGYRNPVPIMRGAERLVQVEDGSCFSPDELSGKNYMPEPDEIAEAAAKTRADNMAQQAKIVQRYPSEPAIREIDSVRDGQVIFDSRLKW